MSKENIDNKTDSNFKKPNRFKNALKYGFAGAVLASAVTGVTAAALVGTGTVTIPLLTASFITLPFMTIPLLAPVITAMAAIIIASFLAGIAVKSLYDRFANKKNTKDNNLKSNEKKEGQITFEKEIEAATIKEISTALKNKNANRIKELCNATLLKTAISHMNEYIEDISKALKKNDKNKVENLCNSVFFKSIPLFESVKKQSKKLINEIIDEPTFRELEYKQTTQTLETGELEQLLERTALLENTKELYELLTKYTNSNVHLENDTLQTAAKNGFAKVVSMLLINNDIDVNSVNINGRTPLHYAALYGHIDSAKILLINGADTEVKDKMPIYGYTPLHNAAQNGQMEMVQLLLSSGADINATTTAATYKHVDLNSLNHDILFKGKEILTPLQLALRSNQIKIINFLLQNGADIPMFSKNEFSKKAINLIKAEHKKRNEIFNNIKKGILEINSETMDYLLRIKDKDGNTLLHLAAKNGQNDIVAELIKNGADIHALNINGDNPSDLAANDSIKNLIIDENRKRNEIFNNIEQGTLKIDPKEKDYYLRIKDQEGNSFLHATAKIGNLNIAITALMKDLTTKKKKTSYIKKLLTETSKIKIGKQL